MFFEIMREMRNSRDFPKAVGMANVYMSILYTMTSALAYYYKGIDVQQFLPDNISARWAKIIVSILLTYHVVIAYMLTAQPLAEQIQRKIWPWSVGDYSARGQTRWALIQAVLIAFSYVVANLIPFFADFQNIIGAAMGAPIMFGWPAVFYVWGMRRAGRRIPIFDVFMCGLFLLVMTPFCTFVGTVAAGMSLANDWSTFGKPFSCHLKGY
jgi:hypothetical protein